MFNFRRRLRELLARRNFLARASLVGASIAAITVAALFIPSPSSAIIGSTTSSSGSASIPAATSTTTTSTTTTTTTTTTTQPLTTSGDLIAVGPSRRECVDPNFTDTGLKSITTAVAKFDKVTDTTVTCLTAYLNGEPTWSQWEHPWITSAQYGYTQWVAQEPSRRQLVLQVDLIPSSLDDLYDPLAWEQSCADGHFNSYATDLGTSLVAAGLQNTVIRLGAEMNGVWEADYMGSTSTEQVLWAKCFANEVTGLRQAAGEHFLMDWDPNACNLPYSTLYPGNAFVDIVGLDIYNVSCQTPKTPVSYSQLVNEGGGLASFEAFAAANDKPMSLPEWGLKKEPSGDDPSYIDGIGAMFDRRDFAFEAYFNVDVKIRPYLALGNAPKSLAAFKKWFGSKKS
jgi:beta-mannanase